MSIRLRYYLVSNLSVAHKSLLQNYKNAVTPAEAGVQKPLTSLDSCFRRNDRKKQV